MRNLVEQNWWDWAIEDQVTLEELNLLDSLPSLDWCCRWWCWIRSVVGRLVIWLAVWIWTVRLIAENWTLVVAVEIFWPALVSVALVSVALVSVAIVWRWLVWLVVVCVVMIARVECEVLLIVVTCV